MAATDGLTFEGTFNNSSTGLFKTNTTQAIGSDDQRALVTAIKESYLNRIDDVKDEDDMASNSAVAVPSQQSVKAYVDAAALGIVTSWKAPVVNATTANITLSGEQTIDGVLTSASRILVKDQSTQSENGIYVTAAGAWARSSDANVAAELEGAAVTVQQGTANANTTWIQTTDGITLGSSNIVFAQLGSSVPDASETVKGIIEIATQAETNTGTDDVRALTPLKAATRYDKLPVRADVTLANGVVTIDWSAGDIQNLTITEAKVITTISNPVVGKTIILIIPGTNSLTFSTISAIVEGTYVAGVENRIYIECLKVSGGAEYRITYDHEAAPYPFDTLTSVTNSTAWTTSLNEWFSKRQLTLTEDTTISISGPTSGYQGECWITASGADRTVTIPSGTGHRMMGVGDPTVKNFTIPSAATYILWFSYNGTTYRWGYIEE